MRISDWSSDVCSSDLRATPPIGAGMAWNIPGKNDDGGSGKDRRNPWKPGRGNGGGLGGLFDNFRGIFYGGDGSPLRWVGLALVLWLDFNCFVLVAAAGRGVVPRTDEPPFGPQSLMPISNTD